MTIPSSMPEQVQQIKDMEISYRTLHSYVDISNLFDNRTIRVPFLSLLNKYKDFLSDIITSIELDEEQQNLYSYKPKAVSLELYNTTELWHTILILNKAVSVIDFKPKTLYFYDPEKFKMYINEIMILENILD